MKIVMQVNMSGTRNGEPWPAKGTKLDLPNDEAAMLCANGLAVPVAEWDGDVETREAEVSAGPDSERENEKDAVRSAKAAEKRAQAQTDSKPEPAKKSAAKKS